MGTCSKIFLIVFMEWVIFGAAFPLTRAEGFCQEFDARGLIPGSEAPLPTCRRPGIDWGRREFMLPLGAPVYVPQPPTAPGDIWYIAPDDKLPI
jgi:hypothetical protein